MSEKEAVFHLIDSSYADFLSDFITTRCDLRRRYIRVSTLSQITSPSLVLLSPSPVTSREMFQNLKTKHKYIVATDINHQNFDDLDALLGLVTPQYIISPFAIPGYRVFKSSSIYTRYLKEKIPFSRQTLDDYLFISQPLIEDREAQGLNQFEMIMQAIQIAKQENRTLFIKRHPREETPLPTEISTCENVKIWNNDLIEALGIFKNLIGFNSLPLLSAKQLGFNVLFWNLKSQNYSKQWPGI